MIRLINQFFTCPTWHRPLLAVVPDGIEIRCRSCQQTHFIGRSHIEQAWSDLELVVERETRHLHIVHA